ncbi:carboxyltransferase domain-containing protein [Pedococcus sp. KACC 23699]|uniref:Carboxyltransferase domain-containing protein n=1 Tax=Pedococcus sp. KACC 23699 TaxID=3149228 RepID=A0AAU7JWL5_9MICO
MAGRLLPYGDHAVLAEVADLHEALALHRLLQGQLEHHAPGRAATLVDAVAGARSLLLVADSPESLPFVRELASAALATLEVDRASRQPPDRAHHDQVPADLIVEVPVRYDGDDLHEVARLSGLSPEEVVAAHTGRPWRVGFAGFAPGFAYLVDGDPRLQVPRRPSPRRRVSAGAVGLADEFSGIYPRQSPGGWQLIGHTDLVLWDLDRDPPALLRPGLWVQFADAGGGS